MSSKIAKKKEKPIKKPNTSPLKEKKECGAGKVELILKSEPNSNTFVEVNGKKVGVQSMRLSAGHTMNLGDYESARIDVGITVTPIDGVTIEEMAEAGWSIVYDELRTKIRELKAKKDKTAENGK